MTSTTDIAKKARMRALGIACCAALGALGALLFVVNPAQSPISFCVVRLFTGLYCPGCGGTRALHALLHLDIAEALRLNAFLVPLMPILAYMVAAELLRLIAGRYLLPQLPINPWVVGAVGAAFILFGILRNVPAFAFLAPA